MELAGIRVLVTGGTGFLGHHLVRALVQTRAEVMILLQPHEKTWRLEYLPAVDTVRTDLTDPGQTRAAVAKANPRVIIHLAGRMERRRDVELLDDLTAKHVTATVNLIRAADPAVTRLILNTGTSEEYGEQPDPFVETMAVDPVSPYSATKAAATAVSTYLSKQIGLPVVTMRPFITYGPGQIHDTLIPFLIQGVLRKKAVDLTAGHQYRDFIYVTDLVSCYLAVIARAESLTGPEIFNIGTGQKARVRDVIEIISDLLGGHEYLRLGARPMRAGEPPSMMADVGKARRLLGWEPRVSLKEGLATTVEWWRANPGIWE